MRRFTTRSWRPEQDARSSHPVADVSALRRGLERGLNAIWYGRSRPWPGLGLLERLYIRLRQRRIDAHAARPSAPLTRPVIVVGNITAGGAGKTPLVLALLEHLRQAGWRPGVVSRGYGRRARGLQRVQADSSASEVGDEPLLLQRRSGVPVMVGSDRRAAAQALIDSGDVDLIVSDDGLEHWPLPRQLEIVVIDARRGFGNGRMLPLGPLRAPAARSLRADLLVSNRGTWPGAHEMSLQATGLYSLDRSVQLEPTWLRDRAVLAAAGIGHPQRFFDTLTELGAHLVETHALSDHASAAELRRTLARSTGAPWVVTEKDAMKLSAAVDRSEILVLRISARLTDGFWSELRKLLADRGLQPHGVRSTPG